MGIILGMSVLTGHAADVESPKTVTPFVALRPHDTVRQVTTKRGGAVSTRKSVTKKASELMNGSSVGAPQLSARPPRGIPPVPPHRQYGCAGAMLPDSLAGSGKRSATRRSKADSSATGRSFQLVRYHLPQWPLCVECDPATGEPWTAETIEPIFNKLVFGTNER